MPQDLRQKGLYACQASAIFFLETRADDHQGFCSGDSNASQSRQGPNLQTHHTCGLSQTLDQDTKARNPRIPPKVQDQGSYGLNTWVAEVLLS
jgi:hypothetical protein